MLIDFKAKINCLAEAKVLIKQLLPDRLDDFVRLYEKPKSRKKIDFESHLVGKAAQKDIVLRNQSLVPAHFTIEKINDDGKDDSFNLSSLQGVVPPNAAFSITAKFVPTVVGLVSCTAFKIRTVGGNELQFSCVGCANGFNVYLSNRSVHWYVSARINPCSKSV